MTVRQQLIQMMFERGLFESMANHVLDNYVDNRALAENYHKLWGDYSWQFHSEAWLVVSCAVIDFMDAEMPLHFARSLFEVSASASPTLRNPHGGGSASRSRQIL